MSKPRKKKSASHSGGKRKLLWALAGVLAVIIAILALTQPRQLPAVIADHHIVRTAYAWRDVLYTKVHHTIYPLAALRDDNSARDEVGYQEKDRDALDQLLKSKEDTQP